MPPYYCTRYSFEPLHTHTHPHPHPSFPPPPLPQDDKFKSYVELYAKEKKTFYSDFAAAFAKLLELGTTGLKAV